MARVYGKQSTRPNSVAAQCFADSSSPSKSSRHSTRNSNSSAPSLASEAKDLSIVSTEAFDVSLEDVTEAFVEKIASLRLESGPSSPSQNTRRRAALRERNANQTVVSPCSSPEKKKKSAKQLVIDSSAAEAARLQHSLRRRRTSETVTVDAVLSAATDDVWQAESDFDDSGVHLVPSPEARKEDVNPPASPAPQGRSRRRRSITSGQAQPGADTTNPKEVVEEDHDEESKELQHIQPLLSLVTDPSAQHEPQPFSAYATSLTEHLDISKIAEASFGEVYRLSLAHPEPDLESTAESVLKIIALKPADLTASSTGKKWTKSQRERIEGMSNPTDVASESRLLQRMRAVPGFADFRALLVLRGPLPAPFLTAWRHFDTEVKPSEFPDPGQRSSGYLGDEQLWAVLEMEDAGDDLDDKQVPDIWTLWDVFWGVAISLAKGEQWARFEHRDLHLGNVCVRRPPAHVLDHTRKLGATGLQTTLIDYTLSRADLAAECDDDADSVAFFDLASDPAIFRGDATEDYQYAVYRHMRGAVLHADPCATASPARPSAPRKRNRARRSVEPAGLDAPSAWRAHAPLTNLVWLHFVLYRLSDLLAAWPSSARRKGRGKTKAEDEAVRARALQVEEMVARLTELLDLEGLAERELGGAAGLVGVAVERGWLDEADVTGDAEAEGDSVLSVVRALNRVALD